MIRPLAAVLPFALAAILSAQQAAFVPFGQGCTFQSQTLAIGNQGLPRIGSSFQVMYTGPNHQFNSAQQIAWPQLFLGFGTLVTPLPQGLLPQQPPGCQGLITPDLAIPSNIDQNGRPTYENFVRLAIPNNPNLLGYVLYGQWLLLHQQCGFAGCGLDALPTSDAAQIWIGL